jgi:hypothetical protein
MIFVETEQQRDDVSTPGFAVAKVSAKSTSRRMEHRVETPV